MANIENYRMNFLYLRMEFLILLSAVFLVVRWLIVKTGSSFIPKDDYGNNSNYKEPPTIINNYITENHLHISKEDLKEVSSK